MTMIDTPMKFASSLLCLFITILSSQADGPPEPMREFRGVWVASVANIDWPSKPGLTAEVQRTELTTMFDTFQKLGFNAIVLQIRPMCDSLYESKLEPWSEFLTGTAGQSPGYDPLAFAVKEAHARGLELHAWFNPYRAKSPAAKSEFTADHLVRARPDLAKKYGKHYWLNPTHPEVQKHSLAVIADVVARYDLDGIHLDDYFYPYPELDEAKVEIPFPDDDTWKTYQDAGGKLTRDDWRRDAVNSFVKSMYTQTKAAKPWVKVGISPFGIWRPANPPGIEGFDQYGKLYADAKLWWNAGWVDYFTPQLYWPIAQEKQSYPKLMNWWASENTKYRHLWIGNIPSRIGSTKTWLPTEIIDQINLTRKVAGGNIHFSAKAIQKNTQGIADLLSKTYAEPALVPASTWLSAAKPSAPKVTGNAVEYDAKTSTLVVQTRAGEKWDMKLMPGVKDVKPTGETYVRVMDRYGNLSEAVRVGK
jgi:uncharacterized lipoprotein YddW (UPF0748 family)